MGDKEMYSKEKVQQRKKNKSKRKANSTADFLKRVNIHVNSRNPHGSAVSFSR